MGRKTRRKNQWASDRRAFIISLLSNLATLLVAKIGTLLWTRKRRDATIQAVPASATATAPAPVAYRMTIQAGLPAFHADRRS